MSHLELADLGQAGLGGCDDLSCLLPWLGISWGLAQALLGQLSSVLHASHPLPAWASPHRSSEAPKSKVKRASIVQAFGHIMLSNVPLIETSQTTKPKDRE